MGTKRFLHLCLGVWRHRDHFWAFHPTLVHDFSLPGLHFPSKSILSGSAQGQVHKLSHQGGACTHTQEIHTLNGHKQVCTQPPRAHPPSAHTQAQVSPPDRGPGPWCAFSGCAVFPPAAAQRADVGGEAAGASINHSQMLLRRLQELLQQGNASDVVLRVRAAGTDEVRVFHAHRLLLGMHSELFRELLSNQSEVVLQEPRDCAAVFDKFVRWGGEGLGWGGEGGSFTPSQAPGSSIHSPSEVIMPIRTTKQPPSIRSPTCKCWGTLCPCL